MARAARAPFGGAGPVDESADGRGVRGGDFLSPLRSAARRCPACGHHGARVRQPVVLAGRGERSSAASAAVARRRGARDAHALRGPLRAGAGGGGGAMAGGACHARHGARERGKPPLAASATC